jgi:hypothetical protein
MDLMDKPEPPKPIKSNKDIAKENEDLFKQAKTTTPIIVDTNKSSEEIMVIDTIAQPTISPVTTPTELIEILCYEKYNQKG